MRPYPSRPSRGGFTLIELLAVVAIIGTLVALVMPAVQRAREAARAMQCQSQLHQIGIAYHSHRSARSGQRSGLLANGWVNRLLPFLESQTKTFICPNDETQLYDTGSNSVYIVDNDRTIPLAEGPWCWKGDKTECEERWGRTPTSQDGYFLVFEDMSFDSAYDGVIMIDPQPDGTVECEHVGCNPHAYTHVLLATETGEELFRPFMPGNKWTLSAARTSYAINSTSARFTTDSNKILSLEYEAVVADVVGERPRGLLAWGTDVAERHTGTLNVLYGDGRVARHTAPELDPADALLQQRLWCPVLDCP